MFTNKKSELTRVESLALSIAQQSIIDLLPEGLKNRNVFFTQITIETVAPKKLEQCFNKVEGKKVKAIKLKAYFTTIVETVPYGREGEPPARPCVEAEMLFQNEVGYFYLWELADMYLFVKDYSDINHPVKMYSTVQPIEGTTFGDNNPKWVEEEERFKMFLEKLSKNGPWGAAVLADK